MPLTPPVELISIPHPPLSPHAHPLSCPLSAPMRTHSQLKRFFHAMHPSQIPRWSNHLVAFISLRFPCGSTSTRIHTTVPLRFHYHSSSSPRNHLSPHNLTSVPLWYHCPTHTHLSSLATSPSYTNSSRFPCGSNIPVVHHPTDTGIQPTSLRFPSGSIIIHNLTTVPLRSHHLSNSSTPRQYLYPQKLTTVP